MSMRESQEKNRTGDVVMNSGYLHWQDKDTGKISFTKRGVREWFRLDTHDLNTSTIDKGWHALNYVYANLTQAGARNELVRGVGEWVSLGSLEVSANTIVTCSELCICRFNKDTDEKSDPRVAGEWIRFGSHDVNANSIDTLKNTIDEVR